MHRQKDNINELEDLLRRLTLSDKDTFDENISLLEKTIFDEEHEDAPLYEKGEEVVKKLEDQFEVKSKGLTFTKLPTWFKYAAVIIIILGVAILFKLFYIPFDSKMELFAENGKMELVLPDSTKVWLNKDGRLSYLSSFSERIVYLEGEAFFDVSKRNGKLFTIIAGETSVEVKGTSFNVFSDENSKDVNIVVLSGEVIFRSEKIKNRDIYLKAGEKGIYSKKDNMIYSVKADDLNELAWKTRKLVFGSVKLEKVIPILSAFYDTEIIINDAALNNCVLLTTFDNMSFQEVLKEMKMILNIEYNFQGKKVIITGEGCNSKDFELQ